MELGWMDDLWTEGMRFGEDALEGFYCPYTNASVCALLTKGWQPQELCRAVDCEQLRYFRPKRRRHRRTV